MRRRLKIIMLVTLILFPSILTSGCWSSKEVENLAFVTLTAFDYSQENGKDLWTVSTLILSTQGSQGGQSDGSASKGNQEYMIIGNGPTQQTAIVDYASKTARAPFYGYSSGLLIGENAAKEKLPEIIENFYRFYQTRPRNVIAVTHGNAQDIMKNKGTLDEMFSKQLTSSAEYQAVATGKSIGVYLYEITSWLASDDRDAVLGEIRTETWDAGENNPGDEPIITANTMHGIAFCRDSKLAGWLNDDEVIGYLLLTRKLSRGQISVPVTMDGIIFSYYIGASNYKIEPIVNGTNITYRITIKTIGEIDDNNGVKINPETIKRIEASINEQITEYAQSVIETAKTNKSDFLGFSEKLHKKNPKFWKTLGPQWREAFSRSDVEVTVKSQVLSSGKLREIELQK